MFPISRNETRRDRTACTAMLSRNHNLPVAKLFELLKLCSSADNTRHAKPNGARKHFHNTSNLQGQLSCGRNNESSRSHPTNAHFSSVGLRHDMGQHGKCVRNSLACASFRDGDDIRTRQSGWNDSTLHWSRRRILGKKNAKERFGKRERQVLKTLNGSYERRARARAIEAVNDNAKQGKRRIDSTT